ncbi:YidC family membrane integrase SpoIIIJ [Fictibacillus sp. KIGAM418]|uniref:Membrane protein insertase YidC n=1 Tax=Fictibacillus marinisediminis TaxID=2878389 RepID=A0A9X1XFW0_9BACL|nr:MULTISPECIES: YidC family membrane integrase SpoIIIJ [unclassified Fictibacillus]MCK6259381.1 YidC family membrane integrase SpoIIIJ [Fictibacillus marinisediminis]UZJ78999.1 YidC family membrane integrase SpoIIIJ [Fictibacillus sp. KU28468]SFE97836.1 protein translocase subunit yidC [Bacillus sp. OV194]
MRKKLGITFALVSLMVLLSGCSSTKTPITPESTGFWDEYFVYPLSWVITQFAEMMGNNYGLSIVVVTILIRLALLPLMIQQTRSSKAMQNIQPELQKLREKYSSKDATTQQKLQQETMQLFQSQGVNPLAGCLPLLIQMPILLGFYHAIMRTQEIKNHSFLWFDLGVHDPYYILPVVAGLTTFLQQKIMMGGTDNPNPQMKMLLYIMPVMIVVFAINFPAALSLYWVIGNLFMIVQTYFITAPKKNKKNEIDRGAKK